MACTSSMSGEYFPSRSALHFAPRTRYCDALGPAPHSRYSVAIDEPVAPPGRVLLANPTAYSTTLSGTGTLRTSDWKSAMSSPLSTSLTVFVMSEVVALTKIGRAHV